MLIFRLINLLSVTTRLGLHALQSSQKRISFLILSSAAAVSAPPMSEVL